MYRIISQRSTLIVAAPDTSYFVLLFQKQGNAAKRQTYCCDSNKDIRRRRQKSREAAH